MLVGDCEQLQSCFARTPHAVDARFYGQGARFYGLSQLAGDYPSWGQEYSWLPVEVCAMRFRLLLWFSLFLYLVAYFVPNHSAWAKCPGISVATCEIFISRELSSRYCYAKEQLRRECGRTVGNRSQGNSRVSVDECFGSRTRIKKIFNAGSPFDGAQGRLRGTGKPYCSFAYSVLACFRIGMSGSASFQRVRKSL
jgi:hypothetical protein